MDKEQIQNSILKNKVLAVIRLNDPSKLIQVIDSILAGGVKGIELTMTIHNAIEWINHGACAVGIGSALVDKKAIENNNFYLLTENAK